MTSKYKNKGKPLYCCRLYCLIIQSSSVCVCAEETLHSPPALTSWQPPTRSASALPRCPVCWAPGWTSSPRLEQKPCRVPPLIRQPGSEKEPTCPERRRRKTNKKKRLGSCAPGCPTCVKMHRGAGFIQALRFCLTSHELGYTCSGDPGQSEDDCPGERQSESNIQRLLRSVPSGDPVLKTDTPPYPGVIIMPGGTALWTDSSITFCSLFAEKHLHNCPQYDYYL